MHISHDLKINIENELDIALESYKKGFVDGFEMAKRLSTLPITQAPYTFHHKWYPNADDYKVTCRMTTSPNSNPTYTTSINQTPYVFMNTTKDAI